MALLCCIGLAAFAVLSPNEPTDTAADDTAAVDSASPSAQTPQLDRTADQSPTGEPIDDEEASPEPVLLTIPDDLPGQNAQIAYDQLMELGFTNIRFGSIDENDTVVILPMNWTVVEVAPEPGTEHRSDSTVVLTCTKQR